MDPKTARRMEALWVLVTAARFPHSGWPLLVLQARDLGANLDPPLTVDELEALYPLRVCDLFDPAGASLGAGARS